MADACSRPALERVAPVAAGVERPGLALIPEPFLGFVKLQRFGDDADDWFAGTFGAAAPRASCEIALGAVDCAWLAPGEWLLTGAEAEVAALAARAVEADGALCLVVDISHARAAFLLRGAAARTALAAHCPLDMSGAEMPVGAAKRSLFGTVGVFISRKADHEGEPVFRLIFDQTMAGYAVRMIVRTGTDQE